MGTHWYHAHHHGSTALHVGGGLIGALIVEPAVAYTLPPNLSKLYSAPSNNKVLVLTHHNFGGGTAPICVGAWERCGVASAEGNAT